MSAKPSRVRGPAAQQAPLPKAFVIRAEKKGADEDFNFRHSVASIHWNQFPDPFAHSYEELVEFVEDYQGDPEDRPGPGAPRQIWQFTHEDDLDEAWS